jgi:hypothetical protein
MDSDRHLQIRDLLLLLSNRNDRGLHVRHPLPDTRERGGELAARDRVLHSLTTNERVTTLDVVRLHTLPPRLDLRAESPTRCGQRDKAYRDRYDGLSVVEHNCFSPEVGAL